MLQNGTSVLVAVSGLSTPKSQVAPRSRTFSSKSSSPTATRAEGHQTHSFDSSGGASSPWEGFPSHRARIQSTTSLANSSLQ